MDAATSERTWHGLEELREVLRCFLRRHSRDDNEIDDVVQETFVRAARHRARLCEPRRLRSWTMRIALNVLADIRRRDQRFSGEREPEDALAVLAVREEPRAAVRVGDVEVERDLLLGHLGEAKGSLRPEDRRLLDSFYAGEGSCARTGLECGIPAHLVKVRLFRARQRLLRVLRQRLARTEAQGHRGATR